MAPGTSPSDEVPPSGSSSNGSATGKAGGVPRRYKGRHKALVAVVGACVLLLLGVLAGFVLLLSGALSTAATTQHFALTYRILDAGLRFSVRTNARGIQAPMLDDPAMIERGMHCYQRYCAQCHGSPAAGRADHAMGMLPTASNLTQSAREWPPEWLYYVTREGVRMTGMPAWGFRLSEDSLWSTVAFMKQLPFLDRSRFLTLQSSSNGERCERAQETPYYAREDRGRIVLRQYACDSCHRIEGVVGPRSHVGPPLIDWARRKYIAGVVPNTRSNLVRWIREPQVVSPGTLMPDLGVTQAHAQVMADYLLGLE